MHALLCVVGVAFRQLGVAHLEASPSWLRYAIQRIVSSARRADAEGIRVFQPPLYTFHPLAVYHAKDSSGPFPQNTPVLDAACSRGSSSRPPRTSHVRTLRLKARTSITAFSLRSTPIFWGKAAATSSDCRFILVDLLVSSTFAETRCLRNNQRTDEWRKLGK